MEENFDTKDEEIVTEDSREEKALEDIQGDESREAEETSDDEKGAESEEDDMTEASEDEADEASSETPEDSEEEDKVQGGKIKKGFFQKKDKRVEQIANLQDRIKRQMAEFENFRKRSEKEKSQMYDMGAKSMLEKILPVVDSFERGFDGRDEEQDDPFAEGMRMVFKQLMTALEDAGVKEIEAMGAQFDPEVHNAVMHVDDDQYGENEIVEVLQKGYTYHDSVIRHSMVKVAN